MSTPFLQLSCPHCGTANRLPAARLAELPDCGRCGRDLVAGRVIELGEAEFEAMVAGAPRPVLADFWAPWCGPCRMMAPAFEQAARELGAKALLVKVNSDQAPQLSARLGIRSIPTLVRMDRGRETARQVGALPAPAIVALARGPA